MTCPRCGEQMDWFAWATRPGGRFKCRGCRWKFWIVRDDYSPDAMSVEFLGPICRKRVAAKGCRVPAPCLEEIRVRASVIKQWNHRRMVKKFDNSVSPRAKWATDRMPKKYRLGLDD